MTGDPLKGTVPTLRVAISASIALLFMVVEYVWLMRDEVKFIWPRLRTSWTPRIYMFARYLGLVCQVFNVCFTVRMYQGIETTPAGCQFWFIYQAATIQLLLVFVEGMLMRRIYALFLRNRVVLYILVSFAAGQVAAMWVSARLSFPSNKHTVTCLMLKSNPGNAFFSITTMTTNIIIFFMTFWRYLRLPIKWTKQGLGRTIFRDSGLSLTAISLMMLFMTLCSLEVIKPSMSGNITYYWFICILWISLGRLIMNHERMLCEERDHGGLNLTSQFDTRDSTWTLEIPQLNKTSNRQSWRHNMNVPMTPTTLTSSVLQTPRKGGRLFAPSMLSSPTECGSNRGATGDDSPPIDRDGRGQPEGQGQGQEQGSGDRPCPPNLAPESLAGKLDVEMEDIMECVRDKEGCVFDGDASVDNGANEREGGPSLQLSHTVPKPEPKPASNSMEVEPLPLDASANGNSVRARDDVDGGEDEDGSGSGPQLSYLKPPPHIRCATRRHRSGH